MSTTFDTDTDRDTAVEAPGAAPVPPARRPGLNTDTLALSALFVAVFAFLAALLAVGLAARAVDEARSAPAGGAGGGGPVTVELMDFMIMPDPITAPAGTTSLTVKNTGNSDHTLGVEDGPVTDSIAPGGEAQLDISSLAPGTYTVICTVAGHKEAGMQGTLTIG